MSGFFCFVPLRFTFVNLALCLPGSLGLFFAVSTFGPSLLRCRLAAVAAQSDIFVETTRIGEEGLNAPVLSNDFHLSSKDQCAFLW